MAPRGVFAASIETPKESGMPRQALSCFHRDRVMSAGIRLPILMIIFPRKSRGPLNRSHCSLSSSAHKSQSLHAGVGQKSLCQPDSNSEASHKASPGPSDPSLPFYGGMRVAQYHGAVSKAVIDEPVAVVIPMVHCPGSVNGEKHAQGETPPGINFVPIKEPDRKSKRIRRAYPVSRLSFRFRAIL